MFDNFVMDIDSPLENAVQLMVDNAPDLVLIPVDRQHEALTRLKDTLHIIDQLRDKLGRCPCVRIVPVGSQVQEIQAQLKAIDPNIPDCRIARKIRYLKAETDKARKERRYIWDYAGCEDLRGYFQDLLRTV
jgi:hypothetical protein